MLSKQQIIITFLLLNICTIGHIIGMDKFKSRLKLYEAKKSRTTRQNKKLATTSTNDIQEIRHLLYSQIMQALQENKQSPKQQEIEQLIKQELPTIFSS